MIADFCLFCEEKVAGVHLCPKAMAMEEADYQRWLEKRLAVLQCKTEQEYYDRLRAELRGVPLFPADLTEDEDNDFTSCAECGRRVRTSGRSINLCFECAAPKETHADHR